jgi:16S rRNA (uracil1498-N3)-methyltransferase
VKKPRVYLPKRNISPDGVTFTDDAAHYVTNVLRLQTGAHIEVFDGDREYLVRLALAGSEVTGELIVGKEAAERKHPDVALAFGCVRPGPFQEILRHGAELGVTRFVPLLTRRAVRRPEGKKSRWETIVRAAVSQSGRARIPEIDDPIELDAFMSGDITLQRKYILSLNDFACPIWEALQHASDEDVILLVGPEGGFDEREEQVAAEAGFLPVRLGDHILRTETAAIVGAGLVIARFGHI